MSILSVIADNSLAIYAVCVPGFLISAGYVAWKSGIIGGGAAGSPSTPAPVSRATPRRPLAAPTKPKSLEAGQAEHQARGEAKTVKVAPAAAPVRDERKIDTARMPVSGPSVDDDSAKDDLFSGLNQAKKEDDANNQRKAERLEELGFHAQAKQIPSLTPAEAAAKGHTELAEAANGAQAKPGDPKRAETRTGEDETKAVAITAAPAPAANRTQTQELDDILSRIDKVLAENPVMATTTLGSASGDTSVIQKPATDAVEKKKTEPNGDQQKLF